MATPTDKSQRPSILITRPVPDAVVAEASRTMDVRVRKSTEAPSREEMRRALDVHDGIIPTLGDPLDGEMFRTKPDKCRILANFGAGYNHIDVDAARSAGVIVTNTPGAVTDATADIAVLLMLMTARRAGEGERLVRSGEWEGWHPVQMLGTHLTGKTLGIVGMGNIGRAVACRCHHGFRMPVVYFNRSRVDHSDVSWATPMGSIKEVMEAADVVSINVPGGAGNRHLIDRELLACMKSEAILVNTARGDVIDEAALVEALQAGRITGAGLDVYENEPSISPELLDMENVTLLPHLGTATLEVRTGMGLMSVENLVSFFSGRDVPNPVN